MSRRPDRATSLWEMRATMEHADKVIPTFLQYGATGILALAFLAVIVLAVRADKRAATYAKGLEEAAFDRHELIQIVGRNTEAYTALAQQIAQMCESQARNSRVAEVLLSRLENDRCPLLKESGKD